jgi:hypothetical protein
VSCRALVALVAAAGLLVTGCGSGFVEASQQRDLEERAEQVLTGYATAARAAEPGAFIPVGNVTGQIGDWERDRGDNKAALMARRLVAERTLSTETPANGVVLHADGSQADVSLVSARRAFDELVAEQRDCRGCSPLLVLDAELGSVAIETTHGPATAPAWIFTLRDTRVRVFHVAVDPRQEVVVPHLDAAGFGHQHLESASISPDGRTLTVEFTGAGGPASEPCGADYEAKAVESEFAVTVIVVEHRYEGSQMCAAMGFERRVEVALRDELGDRPVLDLSTGTPVHMTRR